MIPRTGGRGLFEAELIKGGRRRYKRVRFFRKWFEADHAGRERAKRGTFWH